MAMDWLILINVAFIFLSWKWAQECEMWSFSWWFNMVASAMNAVAVLVTVMK